MEYCELIKINENALSEIINEYCSCGGRGPDEEPCTACAIYHLIKRYAEGKKEI